MKADRASVSWDEQKRKWLLRIVVGEEVIRRYCDHPHDVDKAKLIAATVQTASDEGYDLVAADVVIE